MCVVYLSFNISGKLERQEEVDKRGFILFLAFWPWYAKSPQLLTQSRKARI